MKNKKLKVKSVKTLVPEQLKKISAAKGIHTEYPCDSNATCTGTLCGVSSGDP